MTELGVIVVAGGSGKRMGAPDGKNLLPLAGSTVLGHALAGVAQAPGASRWILVGRADEIGALTEAFGDAWEVIEGGVFRLDSVERGLEALGGTTELVLIHDGARPSPDPDAVARCVAAASETGAAVVGTRPTDTIKRLDGDRIAETLDRSGLLAVQTPQVFRTSLLAEAVAAVRERGDDPEAITDDALAIELHGHPVTVVEGPASNLKVTRPKDLAVAAALLGAGPRTGLGFDSHAMADGRNCRLGGLDIDCPVGPVGHSDGDAVLHALEDALLGAAALGDLGSRYPDDDPAWEGADSRDLLARTLSELAEAGWRPAAVDVCLVCERPKIAPIRDALRASLAALLDIDLERVEIKGKSPEGLDLTPRGDTVTALVLATIAPL